MGTEMGGSSSRFHAPAMPRSMPADLVESAEEFQSEHSICAGKTPPVIRKHSIKFRETVRVCSYDQDEAVEVQVVTNKVRKHRRKRRKKRVHRRATPWVKRTVPLS